MKQFFGSLFGSHPTPKVPPVIAKAPPPIIPRGKPADFYKQGDVIGGKFEVRGTLGKGGFGVVYLAYDCDTRRMCALKTFRDELLTDPTAREAFKKEALLWVNLGNHPFILPAFWAAEVFGRLFVVTAYVAADSEGRVNLEDHIIRANGPLNTTQALEWAIQFCIGMEHARAHGIECHRDIKPGNILIKADRTLAISDFGLAAAADTAWRGVTDQNRSVTISGRDGIGGLSLTQANGNIRCGTPGYMPPEVYRFERADARSDIYSFGLVLWQMASGRQRPPFTVPWRGDMVGFLQGIYEQQMEGRLPPVDGPIGPIVERCLRPKPLERYANFTELRHALEPLFEAETKNKFEMPPETETTSAFWNDKGGSLAALGKREEAIACYDKALAINPQNAAAWNNKGISLEALGHHEEGLLCYNKSLSLNSQAANTWTNKGACLAGLNRPEEAIVCYDQALAINTAYASAWYNKGNSLKNVQRYKEAIACFDKALAIDTRDADAWSSKAGSFDELGQTEQAIACYSEALVIDPLAKGRWYKKAKALRKLGRAEQEMDCYDRELKLQPKNPTVLEAKADALCRLGRDGEAVPYYDKALAGEPQAAALWNNKGAALQRLDRYQEAVVCYDRALQIDPQNAFMWMNKAKVLAILGRTEECMSCINNALAIDPRITERL